MVLAEADVTESAPSGGEVDPIRSPFMPVCGHVTVKVQIQGIFILPGVTWPVPRKSSDVLKKQ